jgi:short-subunit dehydrogenase
MKEWSTMSEDFAAKYGPMALVTGAAYGIGRGFAEGLGRRGVSLLLVDVEGEALEATAGALRDEFSVSVETLVADLSDLSEVNRVCDVALEREVGLLVNNAGIGASGAFLDIPLDDHLAGIEINIRACVVLTHRLMPPMCERGRGGLIFTSSMSALIGAPGVAQYAATKVYERNLAEALYGELHSKGIDVLALLPGMTRTRQTTENMTEEEMESRFPMDPGPVAELALAGLGKKRSVVPGWINQLQAMVITRLPRGLLLRKLGDAATAPK